MININLSDTKKILDLGTALSSETLSCNRLGACFASSSILCNTRSWHGLLSIPDDSVGGLRVLLSNTDDCLTSNGRQFYLCTRKYPELYFPNGHQFIYSITDNPTLSLVYKIGNINLKKEVVLCEFENTILARYSLLAAEQPVKLQIRPLVAFRNADCLLRFQRERLTGNEGVRNGILYKPNEKGLQLFMQTSVKSEFVTAPDWNYNIEYVKDQADGKQYQEDLFMPGFFEITLNPSESFIFSASVKRQKPNKLSEIFETELSSKQYRQNFDDDLVYMSNQFLCERKNRAYVVTGFPNTKITPRSTFIAAPGLMLPTKNNDMFLSALDTMQAFFRFRNIAMQIQKMEIDTPFWFLWALQQYYFANGNAKKLYKTFEYILKRIILRSTDNSLPGISITSMGAAMLIEDGEYVYTAQLNALMYNGLMFAADLSAMAGNNNLSWQARENAEKLKVGFKYNFEYVEGNTIASKIIDGIKDFTTCPGKLLAFALPYSIASSYLAPSVLEELETKLLTPFGLRMLPPDHPDYNEKTGYVAPQYSGFLAELYLRIYGEGGIEKAKKLYQVFDTTKDFKNNLIGEKYDGTPPYKSIGAVLDAVSVAEILRIKALTDNYKKTVI